MIIFEIDQGRGVILSFYFFFMEKSTLISCTHYINIEDTQVMLLFKYFFGYNLYLVKKY